MLKKKNRKCSIQLNKNFEKREFYQFEKNSDIDYNFDERKIKQSLKSYFTFSHLLKF